MSNRSQRKRTLLDGLFDVKKPFSRSLSEWMKDRGGKLDHVMRMEDLELGNWSFQDCYALFVSGSLDTEGSGGTQLIYTRLHYLGVEIGDRIFVCSGQGKFLFGQADLIAIIDELVMGAISVNSSDEKSALREAVTRIKKAEFLEKTWKQASEPTKRARL